MQALFVIPTSGDYTFTTGSDDGSDLFIDGQLVVNNAYYQGYTVRSGTVYLTAVVHPFDLEYFQGGGGAALSLGAPSQVLIEPTPEPTAWAPLLVCGLAAISVLRRRRRLHEAFIPS
jgi:MYXO-CTERM domain-containing protein